jgi:hypothetical protein
MDSLVRQFDTVNQEYLKGRAIWTDQDLVKFAVIAFVVGIAVGVIACL